MTQQSVEDDKLREIVAIAAKATPGDRVVFAGEPKHRMYVHPIWTLIDGRPRALAGAANTREDAAYIAACDPQTITSIITELLASREKLKAVEQGSNPVAAGTDGAVAWRWKWYQGESDGERIYSQWIYGAEHPKSGMEHFLEPLYAHPTPTPGGVTEADIERVARAIAEQGFGRPWDDFLEVNAFDTDQSDLKDYALAALAASPSVNEGRT